MVVSEDAVQGDLGYSYVLKTPVTKLINRNGYRVNIELAYTALLFSLIMHYPIGILSQSGKIRCSTDLSMAGAFSSESQCPDFDGHYFNTIFSSEITLVAGAGADRF
jgi:ABC-type dipeptide/oligopeptide/nickel transport system permease component